jgi:hypothetical protein
MCIPCGSDEGQSSRQPSPSGRLGVSLAPPFQVTVLPDISEFDESHGGRARPDGAVAQECGMRRRSRSEDLLRLGHVPAPFFI